MSSKRTIVKYSIYLLITALFFTGVAYDAIAHWPKAPPKITYTINVPSYPNATYCQYWLQSMGDNQGKVGDNQLQSGQYLSLPHSINGTTQNNTACTLEVWYYTSYVAPITGNNTQPIIIYNQVADEHYELSIVGSQP